MNFCNAAAGGGRAQGSVEGSEVACLKVMVHAGGIPYACHHTCSLRLY